MPRYAIAIVVDAASEGEAHEWFARDPDDKYAEPIVNPIDLVFVGDPIQIGVYGTYDSYQVANILKTSYSFRGKRHGKEQR